eukprot:4383519-Amphidinium_carterae.1
MSTSSSAVAVEAMDQHVTNLEAGQSEQLTAIEARLGAIEAAQAASAASSDDRETMAILGGWPKDTTKKEILAFICDHLAADALSACTEYFCPGPRVAICLVKFPSKKALHSAMPLVKQKAHLKGGSLWLSPSRPPEERDARSRLTGISSAMQQSLPDGCNLDLDVVYKTGLIFIDKSRVVERKQDGSFRILEDNLIKELSAPYGKCTANAMREAAAEL